MMKRFSSIYVPGSITSLTLQGWVVSLAPTFPAAYDECDAAELVGLFYETGARAVADVATVILEVNSSTDNFAPVYLSSCPKIREMIKKRFQHKSDLLNDAPPPAVLHARRLRQQYPGYKVLFVGPCPYKLKEAVQMGGADMAITFSDLNIDDTCTNPKLPDTAQISSPTLRLCCLNSGISGYQRCVSFLEDPRPIKKHYLPVEMTYCRGGCIAGDGMTSEADRSEKQQRIINYALKLHNLQESKTHAKN